MFKHMTKYSANDLLNELNNSDIDSQADFIIAQQQDKELPLYIRVLIGVGAFLTSIFIIGFLSIILFSNVDDIYTITTVFGLLFIAAAIFLAHIVNHQQEHSVKHSFFLQTSFAFMATGKSLLLFGLSKLFNSEWTISWVLLIMTISTYFVYKLSIDRFLSSFAFLFSVLVNIVNSTNLDSDTTILFIGFFLIQLTVALFLIISPRVKHPYLPIAYALIFSLCSCVIFIVSQRLFFISYHLNVVVINQVVNWMLVAALIFLILWINKFQIKSTNIVLALIGSIVLGFISAPGIILAILLMIIGYAKHEKLLIVLAGLLLPVFLFYFYYSLNVTLLQKSIILITSGVLLLAARFYLQFKIKHQGKNQGESHA